MFQRWIPISGTNTYAVNITSFPSSYNNTAFKGKLANASTGAATINVNGLGAKKIYLSNLVQAGNGDLLADLYDFIYDSTLDSGVGGFFAAGSVSELNNIKRSRSNLQEQIDFIFLTA